MNRIAIIDNSVLAAFIDAGLIDLLENTRIIFRFFLVPEKVRSEFLDVEPKFLLNRQRFNDLIGADGGFYRLCTTVDKIILGVAESFENIDAGEAEAIAQAQKRKVFLFFTDDQKCRDVIGKNFIWLRTMSTHSLIAALDIAGFLSDAPKVWQTIHSKLGFTHKQLKQAVENAFFLLEITPDKKIISEKSSWKRIFGEAPKKKRSRSPKS